MKKLKWKRISVPKDLFSEASPSQVKAELSQNIRPQEAVIKKTNLGLWPLPEPAKSYMETGAKKYSYCLEDQESIQLSLDLKEADLRKEQFFLQVKAGASAEIFLDYRSQDLGLARLFSLIEIDLEEGASLKLSRVNRLNEASYALFELKASLAQASYFIFNDVQTGTKYKAVSTEVDLAGKDAKVDISSLYFCSEACRADLAYTASHSAPKTLSTIVSKGVVKKKGKKVFRGNLHFMPGSKKSVGREEETCLLFDQDIQADSIPALMCSEDDVIGEHAASIGRFDQGKMFYLMSRGFSEEEAKLLVTQALFSEVLKDLEEPVLDEIVGSEIKRLLED